MKWIIGLVALATIFLVRPAAATVVVVPLPSLQGLYTSEPEYAGAFQRTVQVQLPATPSVIYSVSMHVKGTSTFGNYSCDGSGGYGPPSPVAVNVSAEIHEGDIFTTQQWAYHEGYLAAQGAFDLTRTFARYPEPTDWSFLLDGSANLTLSAAGVPPIPECVVVGPGSQTTFDSVELIIDGEFPTPAATTSWGHMKAIYR